ncbi:MAG: WbqC family protein [Selenomonadaceae bacterium]|nr:WbqC family protein [Selenomonadaceae bacterium]
MEKKRVAVLQSNYIPWKGYFDIIHDVDLFIFYDDVQYTKNDWRNRNKILVQGKPVWLTIPVGASEHRLIIDVQMQDKSWQEKHYLTLKMAYGKLPAFKLYEDFFYNVYMEKEWQYLYELNRYLIEHISRDFLSCKTKFADSRDFPTHGVKHERLLSLAQAAGADVYVSGPAAKDYIVADDYERAGIELVWKDYAGYPSYSQSGDDFLHEVSILDLLFHKGKEASHYIWGWRE